MNWHNVLITGASSGLGRALAQKLAPRCTSLILVGRNLKELQATAESLSVTEANHIAFPCDLSLPKERASLIALIQERPPDLIVNNAGFGLYGEALSSLTAEHLALLEVNITALTEITLEGARAMKAHRIRGTILNVSSAAAFFPYPTFASYAAAKRYGLQFSRALDVELAPQGIRILTSCPGQFATSFRSRASRGRSSSAPGGLVMDVCTVADAIVEQIDAQQQLNVIDWRYRLLIALSKFVPEQLLMRVLRKSLNKINVSRDI